MVRAQPLGVELGARGEAQGVRPPGRDADLGRSLAHPHPHQALDSAYRNAFAGRARLPRFKSRRGAQRARVGFDARHAGKVRAWLTGRLVLPGLGAVKLRGRTLPRAMPKLVSVTLDAAGRYWVSFAVDEAIAQPAPAMHPSVGIDVGVAHLATLSTGEHVENPRALAKHLARLARLQQRLARQCRGSRRHARTRTRIARVHARIADCRREHLHRLSTRLVHENQVIAIEALNAEGMGRSAKGTREAPGRNVGAKAGLNRSVKDAAFGELRRQLTYKAAWYGRTVVAVDRFFASSRLCSGCGAHKGALGLDERRWRCASCSAEHDRDVNAAVNIEAEGLRILMHPEDTGSVRAFGGEGERHLVPGPVAVSARIGRAA